MQASVIPTIASKVREILVQLCTCFWVTANYAQGCLGALGSHQAGMEGGTGRFVAKDQDLLYPLSCLSSFLFHFGVFGNVDAVKWPQEVVRALIQAGHS